LPRQMMNTTAGNHLRLIKKDKRFDQLAAPSIRATLATTAVKVCNNLRVNPESMRAKTIVTSVTNAVTQ
jgi:hypothetical protein